MSQSLRLARPLLARALRTTTPIARRSFAVSAVVRADLIQDLYLKELKAYKAPPQKASDAEGHVQKFTPPSPPKSPEEANLASSMKEYEDQSVEIEGQAATGETVEKEDDYFDDIEDKDEAPAHGH